jgi:hypothetical protein
MDRTEIRDLKSPIKIKMESVRFLIERGNVCGKFNGVCAGRAYCPKVANTEESSTDSDRPGRRLSCLGTGGGRSAIVLHSTSNETSVIRLFRTIQVSNQVRSKGDFVPVVHHSQSLFSRSLSERVVQFLQRRFSCLSTTPADQSKNISRDLNVAMNSYDAWQDDFESALNGDHLKTSRDCSGSRLPRSNRPHCEMSCPPQLSVSPSSWIPR